MILCHRKGGEWLTLAAVIALAYVYGLRVPSELLKQSSASLWQISANTISYGPIAHKHRTQAVNLRRTCVCQRFPALCPHVWARFAKQMLQAGRSFALAGARFNRMFQQLHSEMGEADVRGWTSHAMRRVMALDVMEEHGLGAMQRAGDWNSAGAFAYASKEKVEQRLVGEMFAHYSDDDH